MEKHAIALTRADSYQLKDKQQNQIDLFVDQHRKLNIETPDHSSGSFLFFVQGSGDLDLTITFNEDSEWTYLWVNQSEGSLNVHEDLILRKNAQVKANYGELSSGAHTKETDIHLEGEGATINLRSASITFNKIIWSQRAIHKAKRTYAMVRNYAIGLRNSEFSLDVAGHIYRGFNGSETHQVSRVMNLDPKIKSTVYPKLLIDENDVAASHAASVGQPNPEHVYYLQSRGLSRNAAMSLLTLGYLLPIVQDIEDDDIKQELTGLITDKVSQQWLI